MRFWLLWNAQLALSAVLSTQSTHPQELPQPPAADSQEPSVQARDIIPIETNVTLQDNFRLGDDILHFKVSGTNMRVQIFPFDRQEPLLAKEIVLCFSDMQRQVAACPAEDEVKTLVAVEGKTRLQISRLPKMALNGTNGYSLTYGDAVKLFNTFTHHVAQKELYLAFWYQVYFNPEFIATGFLKPTSWPAGDPFSADTVNRTDFVF